MLRTLTSRTILTRAIAGVLLSGGAVFAGDGEGGAETEAQRAAPTGASGCDADTPRIWQAQLLKSFAVP